MLDLHVDFIIQQTLFGYDPARAHRAGVSGQPLFWHADVPRMKQAGYKGACLGVHFWPVETRSLGWRTALKQIARVDALCERAPGCLRVRQPADWQRAADQGLLAMAPGVEGAHMLGGQLDRAAELGRLGVTYLTLTHFSKNSAGTPSLGRGADQTSGLTGFGRELVAELERAGVFVDVAHLNMPGVLDVCRQATRPVLCTHTTARGVFDHDRGVTDEAAQAIAATGGVIGVMAAPNFMARSLRVTSSVVVDHILHLVALVGPDHVAIGTDLDGWLPAIPSDMRDCRDVSKILDGLRQRGLPDDHVQAIAWGNALRVLSSP